MEEALSADGADDWEIPDRGVADGTETAGRNSSADFADVRRVKKNSFTDAHRLTQIKRKPQAPKGNSGAQQRWHKALDRKTPDAVYYESLAAEAILTEIQQHD